MAGELGRRASATRSCGTSRACRWRPAWPACATSTGRGSSPTSSWCSRPGALEAAPQSLVTLTRIERPADRGAFQRRLAERFPNVTTLDLSSVQRDAGGADRTRRARHPVHGPLHAGHRDAGARRRARHQPVPARSGKARCSAPSARRARSSSGSCSPSTSPSGSWLGRGGGAGARRRAGWALARFLFEAELHTCRSCHWPDWCAAVVLLTVGGGPAQQPRGAFAARRSRCCAPSRRSPRRRLYSRRPFQGRFNMLAIDLAGKRALVAGVSDDGGFGFAIAKALATPVPRSASGAGPRRSGIFTKLIERGKMADSIDACPMAAAWIRADLPARRGLRFPRRCTGRDPREQAVQGAGRFLDRRPRPRGSRKTSASGSLDIVVHSLANAPEVRSPLVDTSRKGYLAAIGVSAYSNVSLVRHSRR